MSTPSIDTALRYLETVRLLPVGRWRTTDEVHADMQALGHNISKRTVQRDLMKLARPFGIDMVDNRWDIGSSGITGTYEWRRTRAIEEVG